MALTLEIVKQHLRADTDEEDPLISSYLRSAIGKVENYTGKKLERGSVTQFARSFVDITLDTGPSPASLVLTYIDSDGAPQTINDASLVGNRVTRSGGWPSIASSSQIAITYEAGYTETPPELDLAVLLLVGEYYENREAGSATQTVTDSVEGLCREHRPVLI